MKIAITGIGYVGLSLAILLSQYNKVVAVDISNEKVEKINKRINPIEDQEITKYLATKRLDLTATVDKFYAYKDADLVIVAVPTNFDLKTNFFDVTILENVIEEICDINKNVYIVIKSTVPVGYTETARKKFGKKIFFSPEFLRESKALYDNLYPSRIIVGVNMNDKADLKVAQIFANLLKKCSLKKDVPVLFIEPTEAEAVKLFSNTYLAMRVAFFNELDSYADSNGLDTRAIINGVCLDNRIGNIYNNPSFGYGGYCLPKDTKQLRANFQNIPQSLISATILSNELRLNFIINSICDRINILKMKYKNFRIGIYRLVMKYNSGNFRESVSIKILRFLKDKGENIVIYEPTLNCNNYLDCKVENDINIFKQLSDFIIANRYDDILEDVKDKVFTRDMYNRD